VYTYSALNEIIYIFPYKTNFVVIISGRDAIIACLGLFPFFQYKNKVLTARIVYHSIGIFVKTNSMEQNPSW